LQIKTYVSLAGSTSKIGTTATAPHAQTTSPAIKLASHAQTGRSTNAPTTSSAAKRCTKQCTRALDGLGAVIEQHLNSLKRVLAYRKSPYPIEFSFSAATSSDDNDDNDDVTIVMSNKSTATNHLALRLMVNPSHAIADTGCDFTIFDQRCCAVVLTVLMALSTIASKQSKIEGHGANNAAMMQATP
jgi:hypothetical protein